MDPNARVSTTAVEFLESLVALFPSNSPYFEISSSALLSAVLPQLLERRGAASSSQTQGKGQREGRGGSGKMVVLQINSVACGLQFGVFGGGVPLRMVLKFFAVCLVLSLNPVDRALVVKVLHLILRSSSDCFPFDSLNIRTAQTVCCPKFAYFFLRSFVRVREKNNRKLPPAVRFPCFDKKHRIAHKEVSQKWEGKMQQLFVFAERLLLLWRKSPSWC